MLNMPQIIFQGSRLNTPLKDVQVPAGRDLCVLCVPIIVRGFDSSSDPI